MFASQNIPAKLFVTLYDIILYYIYNSHIFYFHVIVIKTPISIQCIVQKQTHRLS